MQSARNLTPHIIDTLLTAGSLAPSGGNIQPWKVDVHKDTLSITIAKERSGGALDVHHFASIFALGSFVENIEIAAKSVGILPIVVFEDSDDPFLITVNVICTTSGSSFIEDKELATSIPLRMTNRGMSDGTLLSPETIESLETHIKEKNPSFTFQAVKTNSDKNIVAEILGKTDRIRNCNEKIFEEMMYELRWSLEEAEQTKDGIDVHTLELPKNVYIMLQLLKNKPNIRAVFPKTIYEQMALPVLLSSSHLCCIYTKHQPTHITFFEAGRVVESMWLCATRMELSIHPWTVLPFFLLRVLLQPGSVFSNQESKEILFLREELMNVFTLSEEDTPLFIFRLFKGKLPTARALRLPWKTFTKV
jgi:hypothetical protein